MLPTKGPRRARRPGTMCVVEHLIDLDALASRLQPVLDEWQRRAVVGPLTWRDEAAAWPQRITSDRSSVQVPESLGITLRKHASADEFQTVVWAGGWADVAYVLDGEVCTLCPEFRDMDSAYSAVTTQVADFLT